MMLIDLRPTPRNRQNKRRLLAAMICFSLPIGCSSSNARRPFSSAPPMIGAVDVAPSGSEEDRLGSNEGSPYRLAGYSESDLDTKENEPVDQDEDAGASDQTQGFDPETTATAYPPDTMTVLEATASTMTIDDFQRMAMANNPTLAELSATTQIAAGNRMQVGLRANPWIGYNATQLADEGTDQHTAVITQTIVTGDKLQLNRCVLNETVRAQLFELEAQRYRVATDVEVNFYRTLAAQQRVQLIRDFGTVADEGLRLAELRKKALEGSQLDVVQSKVQKNEIDLALRQAEIQSEAAWRELAAIAGSPNMAPTLLVGELPQSEETLQWDTVAATVIASSPEVAAAQTRIAEARAYLQRQCVQPIPNVDVSLGAGVDNGTNSGMINLQVGAPIPVFNQNQGNIAAARGAWIRANQDLQRIENAIKARLANVSGQYDSALVAVDKYTTDILPNAAEGLTLAEAAYKAGETSFIQVLVARRTYFDSNLEFIQAQSQLAQARAQVDGFVLVGALDPIVDYSGDSSLRDLTFSQE